MLWYCTQLLNIHLCELCRKDEQGECGHMNMSSISGDCQPSASLIESRDRNGVSTVNAARKTHPNLSELQKLYSSAGLWQFSAFRLRSEISLNIAKHCNICKHCFFHHLSLTLIGL